MLNLGAQESRPVNDVSRLSDAELVAQLSEQAKQLGVSIDLSYSFLRRSPATDGDSEQTIDAAEQSIDVTDGKSDA